MSTRPLPPPEVLRDDPGPWSVVSSVFSQAGRPGRRRPPPPTGLMLSPPPEVGLDLGGIDPSSPVAGVGRLRVVAAAREPALHLAFDGGGALRGAQPARRPHVVRAGPRGSSEERPAADPVADLPAPLHPASLAADEIVAVAAAPGGAVVAVHTREGRFDVVALSARTTARWCAGSAARGPRPGRRTAPRLALGGPVGRDAGGGRPRLAGRPGSTGRGTGGPVPSGVAGSGGERKHRGPHGTSPDARGPVLGAPRARGPRPGRGGAARRHPGPHPRDGAHRRRGAAEPGGARAGGRAAGRRGRRGHRPAARDRAGPGPHERDRVLLLDPATGALAQPGPPLEPALFAAGQASGIDVNPTVDPCGWSTSPMRTCASTPSSSPRSTATRSCGRAAGHARWPSSARTRTWAPTPPWWHRPTTATTTTRAPRPRCSASTAPWTRS